MLETNSNNALPTNSNNSPQQNEISLIWEGFHIREVKCLPLQKCKEIYGTATPGNDFGSSEHLQDSFWRYFS
jgi:hypothetical protein